MAYAPIQGYPSYTPYPHAYQDRLAQLQSQYQSSVSQMPQQPQTINQGLLWVQGDAGAKSYLVAPNTTVLLMDSESQRFYIKSTDGAGMPSLRTFEYSEVVANPHQSQQIIENLDDKYVTRTEYENVLSRLEEISGKLNSFQSPAVSEKSVRIKGKGGEDNEQSAV